MSVTVAFVGDLEDVKRITFDEYSPQWSLQPEYNAVFLRAQKQYFNDVLQARGHVFLNEVLDALGLARTRLGSVVGWRRDTPVDFGDLRLDHAGRVELTFNFSGVIADKI